MPNRRDYAVPDQSGRLAIVTGANSGIGFEASRRLALAGADVILAVRDLDKGRTALDRIHTERPRGEATVELLDLASLESVATFSALLLERGRPIDLLINNAGIMAVPRRHTTVDGFELQFATNHLGHFALTGRLLPLLLQADQARVVSLSSVIHHQGQINLDDLQGTRRYSAWGAYAQSKLATLMFAQELHRLSERGTWGLVSNAAHPGITRSNLQHSGASQGQGSIGATLTAFMVRLLMLTPGLSHGAALGALPALFAATSPYAVSGGYYGPTGLGSLTGPPGPEAMAPHARDLSVAARLWSASEGLTGVSFPPVPHSASGVRRP